MKKHHLIFVCSTIFTLLFYNESIGLNLSIFGLLLTGLIVYLYKDQFVNKSYYFLTLTSVLSCVAFAWYGDFVSFCALLFSLIFLQFKTQNPNLKPILSLPIAFINSITSLGRFFMFATWLPEKKVDNQFTKKMIAYFAIPLFFILIFYSVYAFGSEHFSNIFTNYYLDIDVVEILLIGSLGLYISFSFWNYWVADYFILINPKLDNEFSKENENTHAPTFSFLDIDFERKSGEISMILLNVLLLTFIVTYNYEQFFQKCEIDKLSAATHERVNAVIFSIILAVGVIQFYFKNGFNFDSKAKNLKILSKIWIVLNGLLIVSTIIKNSEYVYNCGLTYKRLGVYAFLILALMGLYYTFQKVQNQKTNAYLANKMLWYFYGTILVCSYVNWGNLITNYNIYVGKGIESVYLKTLNYNDESFLEYFSTKPNENISTKPAVVDYNYKSSKIVREQNRSFLSKALYYEFVENK